MKYVDFVLRYQSRMSPTPKYCYTRLQLTRYLAAYCAKSRRLETQQIPNTKLCILHYICIPLWLQVGGHAHLHIGSVFWYYRCHDRSMSMSAAKRLFRVSVDPIHTHTHHATTLLSDYVMQCWLINCADSAHSQIHSNVNVISTLHLRRR